MFDPDPTFTFAPKPIEPTRESTLFRDAMLVLVALAFGLMLGHWIAR